MAESIFEAIGSKFGKFTVTRILDWQRGRKVEATCACGTLRRTTMTWLQSSGSGASCGHERRERRDAIRQQQAEARAAIARAREEAQAKIQVLRGESGLPPKNRNMIATTVYLKPDQTSQLAILGARRATPVAELIRDAIDRFLEAEGEVLAIGGAA